MVSPIHSIRLTVPGRIADKTLANTNTINTIQSVRYSIENPPDVYIDPQAAVHYRQQAHSTLEKQRAEQKRNCRSDYDEKESAIVLKAEHDLTNILSSIEISRQSALYQLEDEHRIRVFEIEQTALQQRLHIEGSASRLLLESNQQKLQKVMNDKILHIEGFPTEIRSGGFRGSISTKWSNVKWNTLATEIPVQSFRVPE